MARTAAEARRDLLRRGVRMPAPEMVYVAPEVDPERVHPEVTLHPGCRLAGAELWLAEGVEVGTDGPAVVENCWLGPGVSLGSGSFRGAVFLAGARMGPAAHVREVCLLEEEATCAHAVGLKQTVLFPFVTVGSLVNFCDCLLAGGTSRRDHSEVGSSYIHFNFTPHQDKATPSLFGDVPRGVMLDQPPIFLGGQGGAVGPVQAAYGSVVAAGTILRRDAAGGFVGPAPLPPGGAPFQAGLYRNVERIVRANVHYMAQLQALKVWYETVRTRLLGEGPLLLGARRVLAEMLAERARRLKELAAKMPRSIALARDKGLAPERIEHQEVWHREGPGVAEELCTPPPVDAGKHHREAFLKALPAQAADYAAAVRSLPDPVRQAGTRWLQAVVESVVERVRARLLPMRV